MKVWSKILLSAWLFSLVVLWQAAGKVEGAYDPVVTSTKITKIETVPEGIYIYGRFGKLRNCSFEGLRMDIVDEKLYSKIDVIFRDREKIRKIGLQKFGPWLLRINRADFDIDSIKLISEHNCHTGYRTVTTTKMYDATETPQEQQ
jgi:hypothetical protein